MQNAAMDAAMEAWSGLFRGAKERAQRFIGQDPVLDAGTGQPDIAPQDAGWVELLSVDTQTRYGRGHLFIWQVQKEDDPMMAELRSFTPDADDAPEPATHDRLAIRPEQEMEMYPVIVTGYAPVEDEAAIVGLIWPDIEMPASLRELGGE